MARMARSDVLYDGCYAHVFSRSIEKRKIFVDREDFDSFIDMLKKEKARNSFHVFHYCLMQTHFHLVVGVGSLECFSLAMQAVKWHYTRRFNAKYKRWGPLWRERFKSMLIEDEKYLYACGQYVEGNPVKAGLVQNASEWQYGSGRHTAGHYVDVIVDKYENQGLPDEIEMDDVNEFTRGWVVGSDLFKFKLKKGWVSPER